MAQLMRSCVWVAFIELSVCSIIARSTFVTHFMHLSMMLCVQQSVDERVSALLEDGMSTKAAAKVVSGELNVRRKDAYAAALRLQGKSSGSGRDGIDSTSQVPES